MTAELSVFDFSCTLQVFPGNLYCLFHEDREIYRMRGLVLHGETSAMFSFRSCSGTVAKMVAA